MRDEEKVEESVLTIWLATMLLLLLWLPLDDAAEHRDAAKRAPVCLAAIGDPCGKWDLDRRG